MRKIPFGVLVTSGYDDQRFTKTCIEHVPPSSTITTSGTTGATGTIGTITTTSGTIDTSATSDVTKTTTGITAGLYHGRSFGRDTALFTVPLFFYRRGRQRTSTRVSSNVKNHLYVEMVQLCPTVPVATGCKFFHNEYIRIKTTLKGLKTINS